MTLYVFGRKATPGSLEYYAGRTQNGGLKTVPSIAGAVICSSENVPMYEDPVIAGFSLYKVECADPILCGVNKDKRLYQVDTVSKQKGPEGPNSISKMDLAGRDQLSPEEMEKNYLGLQSRFSAFLRAESTESLEDILRDVYVSLLNGEITESRHSGLLYNIMKYL